MNIKRKISHQGYVLALVLVILFSNCKKFLDVIPENKKTAGAFWKTEQDVEAATIGGYSKLQGAVKSFFAWSEARGEMIQIVEKAGNNDNTALSAMNDQSINEKNQFANWGSVYATINCLNTVIALAPFAQQNDKTFSPNDLKYYIGECRTLRALCYFYLARTFYQFPYITQYSSTDQQNYAVMPLNADQVMDSVVSELTIAESLVRPSIDYTIWPFKTTDKSIQDAYAKGRVTTPVVWAILTDVYLTMNNYTKALEYASKIVPDGIGAISQYGFVNGANWHKIFNPKNTYEGIFELQFIQAVYNNSGDFTKWFCPASGSYLYANRPNPNTKTYKYWEGDDYQNILTIDARGAGGTYLFTNKALIWKWAGGTDGITVRSSSNYDANYIFYRYSDIFLMKAEALNRMGQSDQAAQMLLTLRNGAGYPDKNISYGSTESLEELILDERARELAFEGKRWYDLVRIAKRQNNFMILAKRIADFKAYPIDQNVWFQKLSDPLSWYMPILYTELDLNKNLVQNPFYKH